MGYTSLRNLERNGMTNSRSRGGLAGFRADTPDGSVIEQAHERRRGQHTRGAISCRRLTRQPIRIRRRQTRFPIRHKETEYVRS